MAIVGGIFIVFLVLSLGLFVGYITGFDDAERRAAK